MESESVAEKIKRLQDESDDLDQELVVLSRELTYSLKRLSGTKIKQGDYLERWR